MKASVITTCKGRWHHLRRTLPLMLNLDYPDYEVILVDYGDPARCSAQALENFQPGDNPVLKTVLVQDDTSTFSPSRARNLGARVADGTYLAFVDGDVMLADKWLSRCVTVLQTGSDILIPKGANREITGTCIVTREMYDKVRGYGEDLLDWGYQDWDFYHRIEEVGVLGYYDPSMVTVIPNTHEERISNYRDGRTAFTSTRNKRICQKRSGLVNPNGYGMGDLKVFTNAQRSMDITIK